MAGPFYEPGLSLHHVATVVSDLDAAQRDHEALGLSGAERTVVEGQGVAVVMFPAGAGWVELISPTDPDGPIAKFMAKRGEGLHHVAYRVKDLQSELDRLAASGVRLIDVAPRAGVHGWKVAFIHPESCNGVLTELVEEEGE